MAVSEEIKEQRRKIKQMPPKQKFRYFLDYYKIPTLILVGVIFLTVSFIHDILTAKDYALLAVLANSNSLKTQEEWEEAFTEYAGIDTDNYHASIDAYFTLSMENMMQTDMANSQRLMALTQTGDLDVLVSDPEVFQNYAGQQLFVDIGTVLTPEEMDSFRDRLYYVDAAKFQEYDGPTIPEYDENGDLIEKKETVYPRDPSTMQTPIPVGIYVTDAPAIKNSGSYSDTDAIFGFTYCSKRTEMSHLFFQYLWEE